VSGQPATDDHGVHTLDGVLVWKTTRDGVSKTHPIAGMADIHLQNVHRFAAQNAHPADHVAALRAEMDRRGLNPL
jgi:hypothetical protein